MSLRGGLGQERYVKNCFNMKWIKSYSQTLLESLSQDELDRELLAAALDGNLNEVKGLLDKGANVNVKSINGHTPLHNAAQRGHAEAARLLIDRGANPDAEDRSKKTSLHWAATNGHEGVARLLIDRGANPNAENRNKETPLHLAAYYDHVEIARLLLDKGARVDAEDIEKFTPLYFATVARHVLLAKLLILYGADLVKGFNSMEEFNRFFEGDISWYEGDLDELERRFKAKSIRRKLF